ncbi:FAD:protein FMN transferase [Oleisolibacter albus]|uniref:FAD:protein FMN transferase n=1 Tax=Oleisolibacter albus TaxID=2171757 RepID=UPI000DF1618A|nr:FAD:protein FMN transferase [Oleisolibacter albus]
MRVLIPHDLAPDTRPPPASRIALLEGSSMGTSWSVKLPLPGPVDLAALRRAIVAELDQVIAEMSSWEPDSDLSRYNRAPAGSWHALPEGFRTVLDCALAIARASGGAFDPSIGPVVNLWGFGPGGTPADEPPPDRIAATLDRCGWQRIGIEPETGRVQQPGGLYLDFSGIAKGFAVDRVAARLRAAGYVSFLVEVGGELCGAGMKPDGTPWWVQLEQPTDRPTGDGGDTLVALHGLCVATSGDSRRHVLSRSGRRLSHSIDPRSGRPVPDRVAAVSVLHPSCMQADAWATALTVLGPEAGLALAAEQDLAALFVLRGPAGFSELPTPALNALLDL